MWELSFLRYKVLNNAVKPVEIEHKLSITVDMNKANASSSLQLCCVAAGLLIPTVLNDDYVGGKKKKRDGRSMQQDNRVAFYYLRNVGVSLLPHGWLRFEEEK